MTSNPQENEPPPCTCASFLTVRGKHKKDSPAEIPVMQFTGLKDKNGKEIYEGDIIRCYATDGSIVYDQEARWPNIYEEMWGKNAEWLCEVIGNVYENPELLKP